MGYKKLPAIPLPQEVALKSVLSCYCLGVLAEFHGFFHLARNHVEMPSKNSQLQSGCFDRGVRR